MDLSKAFDTVGHATLIEKLHSYGVNDSELSWFIDYLFNRTQVVEIDQSQSDPQRNGLVFLMRRLTLDEALFKEDITCSDIFTILFRERPRCL